MTKNDQVNLFSIKIKEKLYSTIAKILDQISDPKAKELKEKLDKYENISDREFIALYDEGIRLWESTIEE